MSATFLQMTTRIQSEMSRDFTTAQVQAAILTAIEHYQTKRFWFNEDVATLATVASQNYVALPTDFIEEDALEITVGSSKYKLDKKMYSEILEWDRSTSTGQPQMYAYYKDRFRFFPVPGSIYTLTLHYIKKLPELVSSSDNNSWTNECEELIRLRVKKDLYIIARNVKAAQDMGALEQQALSKIESLNFRKVSTGNIKARYL